MRRIVTRQARAMRSAVRHVVPSRAASIVRDGTRSEGSHVRRTAHRFAPQTGAIREAAGTPRKVALSLVTMGGEQCSSPLFVCTRASEHPQHDIARELPNAESEQ